MKIKNKLIAWIVVLSTLTLLLSGCFKKSAPAPKPSTKKIELVYFLSIKDHTDAKNMDIAVVEGSITSEEDKKRIENIRKNSKILIGMGSCAITGMPSCYRNNLNKEQLKEISGHLKKFKFLPKCMGIKEVVKLDGEVPGCPMDDKKFIEVFEKYI